MPILLPMIFFNDIVRSYGLALGITDHVGGDHPPHCSARVEWRGEVVGRAFGFSHAEVKQAAVLAALASGPLADHLAKQRRELEAEDRSTFDAPKKPGTLPFCNAWPAMLAIAGEYATLITAAAAQSIETDDAPALCLTKEARARILEMIPVLGIAAGDVDSDLLNARTMLEAEQAIKDELDRGSTIRPARVVAEELERTRALVVKLEGELLDAKHFTQGLVGARNGLAVSRSLFSIPAAAGIPRGLATVPGRDSVVEPEGGTSPGRLAIPSGDFDLDHDDVDGEVVGAAIGDDDDDSE